MLLQFVMIVVIVDAVLSWIMPPSKFPRSLTTTLTNPLYAPIRKVLSPEKMGGFDLSPIIVIFAIQGIKSLLINSSL